jgi:uncharacterized membrane protein
MTKNSTTTGRTVARLLLGSVLVFAGISHLTFARRDFTAQVPPWTPGSEDAVVLASGAVEIGLGAGLIASNRRPELIGVAAATFFTLIFPGNISQLRRRIDAFGLNTDTKRWLRLPFQPLLVLWALWSTGVTAPFGRAYRGN